MNEYKLENVFIKAHVFSFVYCKKNGWNAISIQIELKCVENVSFSLDAPNLYNKCFFSSIYAVNRKFKLMPKKPSYHQIIIAMCVPRTTTKEIGRTTFSTLKNASLKLSCKCQFMLVICMHSLRKCNRTKKPSLVKRVQIKYIIFQLRAKEHQNTSFVQVWSPWNYANFPFLFGGICNVMWCSKIECWIASVCVVEKWSKISFTSLLSNAHSKSLYGIRWQTWISSLHKTTKTQRNCVFPSTIIDGLGK